jgi:hypothetical protein
MQKKKTNEYKQKVTNSDWSRWHKNVQCYTTLHKIWIWPTTHKLLSHMPSCHHATCMLHVQPNFITFTPPSCLLPSAIFPRRVQSTLLRLSRPPATTHFYYHLISPTTCLVCWHSWFNYSSTHHDVVALHLGLLACELLTLHFQPETSDQVMNPASLALPCLALRFYLYLQHTIAWPQLLALLRATGKGATRCSKFRTLRMYEVPRRAKHNRNVGEWRRLHN